MISAKNMFVVSAIDIQNELRIRGVGEKYVRNVRKLMFDDAFMNDVCVEYYIDDDICEENCNDKEEARVVQMIIEMLREACPGSKTVLIDVMW